MTGGGQFWSMVRAIVEAADKAGFLGPADIEALATEWAEKIAAAHDASVAAALNQQAEFYWEASTLLTPTRAVAESTGEESMTAVLDAQIRTMQEVSARLRRRAAQFQGVSAEDQAIHDMAAGARVMPIIPTVPAEPFFHHPDKSLHATFNALVAAYIADHPDVDPKATSFEFVNGGDDGWRIAGHKAQEPAGVPEEEIALGGPQGGACCACCAVEDGRRLCYCVNSGKPKAKWCKCGPCKTAREEGRTAQEGPK